MRQTDTIFQQMYWLMTDGNYLIIGCLVTLVIIAVLMLFTAIGVGTACGRLTKIQEALTVSQRDSTKNINVKNENDEEIMYT